MKNFLMFFTLMCGCFSLGAETMNKSVPIQENLQIIVDNLTFGHSLRNWRSTHIELNSSSINVLGLSNLNASASGQFSKKNFSIILESIPVDPSQLIIVDLRLESHGFIEDYPISWRTVEQNNLNEGLTLEEVLIDEKIRLSSLNENSHLFSDYLEMFISKDKQMTEQEFLSEQGISYKRIPVLDRHAPTNKMIDQLIQFVLQLTPDQWVHYHCKGGLGRTTTFLVMHDMMKNAHQVSLEDILDRHHLLGGSRLLNINKIDPMLSDAAQERLHLIQKFYDYCLMVPDFSQSWSDWLASNPL